MIVYVHKILYETTAEGFGKRCCIWLQGCSRKCKGCMAQNTWNPLEGIVMETSEIINNISLFFEREGNEIEGVTFLGGEPFEQSKALVEMITYVKRIGLSVIVFTGYTLEELQLLDDMYINECLTKIDLLIDGAYKEELRDFSRPWIGSSNQRYLFLSDRYCMEDVDKQKNRVEIRIAKNGSIIVNGMADFQK